MIAWIQQATEIWSEYAVWIIVQNTVFLLLIFGLLHLMKNESAGLKYWIGVIALIKCILPPFLPAPFLHKTAVSTGIVQIQTIPMATLYSQEASSFPFSMMDILFLVWIALFIFILIIPAVSTFTLSRRLKHAKPVQLPGDQVSVPVCITDKILVPMTLGLFKPRIYVPVQWKLWSSSARKMILRHELAHIKRKDAFFRILQLTVQALYAFHPLIWILNRKIEEYREMACDDVSVGPHRSCSVEYARALVRVAEDLKHAQVGYASASALIRQRNELLNRVQYQMEGSMKKMSRLKTALIIGAIILMMLPFSLIQAKLTDASSSAGDDLKNTGKIYGTITDVETGLPLAGANVVLEGTNRGTATDDNGNYFILNVKPGEYDLNVSMMGYGSVMIENVTVKRGASANTSFNLKPRIIQAATIKARTDHQPPPPPEPDEEINFVVYDKPPTPVGGFKAVQENLVYPEEERKAGTEGKVFIAIQIDKSGQLIRTEIEKSLNDACDQAAIDALKAVKWQPAMQRDKPVTVWIMVPIEFALN